MCLRDIPRRRYTVLVLIPVAFVLLLMLDFETDFDGSATRPRAVLRMQQNKAPNTLEYVEAADTGYAQSTPASAEVADTGYMHTDEKPYLIPGDDQLEGIDENEALAIFWKYVNTLQVLCRNPTRVGALSDGGKEVCLDDKYKPKNPCIVYSFGSNAQFDFEEAVVREFNCEVHTFDPSSSKYITVPETINFHFEGLSDQDFVNSKNWTMRTLKSVIAELNHEDKTIDILKIDVEGYEWKAFPEMYATNVLRRVKQICIELHFGSPFVATYTQMGFNNKPIATKKLMNFSDVKPVEQLKVLRILYDIGFRIFMRERNVSPITTVLHPVLGQIIVANEISLINTRLLEE